MKNFKNFIVEDDGMGVVEIILIIIVLIGLVIIFKKQLVSLVNTIMSKMTSQANQI
ncbi:Flp1 family type IVb pilin [[Clostridium] fimetarium]|uniref:Putative Flagellin, Flp1-like, domain n=1 Tax=[Clostridium] fimetarium TaxID=99656 RepID=A0A1I0RCU0_9FIRM|nr:Flp1 family type IVb pilin [[Clostridium] fimetarium]SEW38662.1 Putative Flagellin, Flp1-like, domain [[Clostridium] fimetarium]